MCGVYGVEGELGIKGSTRTLLHEACKCTYLEEGSTPTAAKTFFYPPSAVRSAFSDR